MIVIPPRDPNEQTPTDPPAEALGKLYDQFTNVQNLGEFHAAVRKRDALYELQHQEMAETPEAFQNLHPRDFYRQFDRRADDDDKSVISEAPYGIRQQLKDVLWAERDTAKNRALESYKKLFIDRQLAQLDEDRLHYFGKIADAANDVDRERYLTALIGRLKLSGDVGLLYKEDADRLIENIPSDLDIFSYNREYAADQARAQRLLLYGAYPNIRPELRGELVKQAEEAGGGSQEDDIANPQDGVKEPQTDAESVAEANTGSPTESEEALRPENTRDSESNNGASHESNMTMEDDGYATDADPLYGPSDAVAAQMQNPTKGNTPTKNPTKSNTAGGAKPPPPPVFTIQKFTQPITDKKGRTISADELNQATAVVYGEMTGSTKINSGKTLNRYEQAARRRQDIVMTELGQVGEAHALASILWNRLDNPKDFHVAGEPPPTNLKEVIEGRGQFKSVNGERYNQVMNGQVNDPQAYKLAHEAVENAARNGPMFNFTFNAAVEQNRQNPGKNDPPTINRILRRGQVNMGSGTDFW
jgi:hypothetical protein